MYSLSLFQFVSERPAADVTTAPNDEEEGGGQGEALQSM